MLLILIAIVIVLFYLLFCKSIKSYRLRAWRRSLVPHQQYFNNLFSQVDGFALSKQARIGCDAPEYCYGEIVFLPFIALLSMCKLNDKSVFYDLGSGTGKAVLACAMVFNAKRIIGVELLNELHQSALNTLHQLKNSPDYANKAQRIVFRQGNFCQTPLQDADVIFINASAFFGELWDTVSQHCEQIPSGAQVITTSKPLRSNAFSIQKETHVEMSWGVVKVYIQVRSILIH